jgi:predicted RNase H-like HicB family nuclease
VAYVTEVKFKISRDEGWLIASGINYDIFTQGKNWDELMKNIMDAIKCHFDEPIQGQIMVTTEYQVNVGAEASSG